MHAIFPAPVSCSNAPSARFRKDFLPAALGQTIHMLRSLRWFSNLGRLSPNSDYKFAYQLSIHFAFVNFLVVLMKIILTRAF